MRFQFLVTEVTAYAEGSEDLVVYIEFHEGYYFLCQRRKTGNKFLIKIGCGYTWESLSVHSEKYKTILEAQEALENVYS